MENTKNSREYKDFQNNQLSIIYNNSFSFMNYKDFLEGIKSLNESSLIPIQSLERKLDNITEDRIGKGRNPYSNKGDHFLCDKCHNVPYVNFISLDVIEYSCKCKASQANIIELKNIYYRENKEEDHYEEYLYCTKHNNNYAFYCENCKKNICRVCLRNEKKRIL